MLLAYSPRKSTHSRCKPMTESFPDLHHHQRVTLILRKYSFLWQAVSPGNWCYIQWDLPSHTFATNPFSQLAEENQKREETFWEGLYREIKTAWEILGAQFREEAGHEMLPTLTQLLILEGITLLFSAPKTPALEPDGCCNASTCRTEQPRGSLMLQVAPVLLSAIINCL